MVLRRRRWLSALPRSHPGLCSPLPGVSGVVAGPAGRRGGIWGGVSPGAAPLLGPRTHRRLSFALLSGAALRVVVPAGGHPMLPSRVTAAAGLQDRRSSVPWRWLRIRRSPHLYSRSPAFPAKLSAATFPPVPARLSSVPLLPPCDTGTACFRSQIRCTEVFAATTRQRPPFCYCRPHRSPLDGHCLWAGRCGDHSRGQGERRHMRGPLLVYLHQHMEGQANPITRPDLRSQGGEPRVEAILKGAGRPCPAQPPGSQTLPSLQLHPMWCPSVFLPYLS